MTKEAVLNALTVDMALGCSTNSMLHLPAIAHEIGFDFRYHVCQRHQRKEPPTSAIWRRQAPPTWRTLNEAGGVYAVMKELSKKDLLNLDCMTVTGKTMGENIAGAVSTGIRR